MEASNSLLREKIATIFVMAFITFLGGVLPFKFFSILKSTEPSSRRKWETFISLCSCYSGGVFIAACFLDLIPETEELFNEILKEVEEKYDLVVEFPVTNFVICLGFFMILFIEQTVLGVKEHLTVPDEREPLLGSHHHHHHHHHHHQHHQHHQHQHAVVEIHHPPEDHVHVHGHHSDEHRFHHSPLRSIMLLLALSFHSVFEGVAIGLQNNSGQFFSIVIAVIVHKTVMAFSLGLNIAQSSLNFKNFIVSTIIFSLASPLGVGIGILMMDLPPSLMRDSCNGVLQGIAGGTFLYITFFDVLPPPLSSPGSRVLKVLFVILGYASICTLMLLAHV